MASFDSKIIYTNTTNDTPHTYAFDASINSVARTETLLPIEFPDLEFYLTPGDRGNYTQYIGKAFNNNNAIPYINEGGRNTSNRHDLWLTQGITLNPIEGLVIKGNFSYNALFQYNDQVRSKIEVIQGFDLNNLSFENGFSGNDFVNNQVNYNQNFVYNVFGEYTYEKLENNFFQLMVGFNQEEYRTRRLQGRKTNLITPGITDLDATTGDQFTSGGSAHYALRGGFFRFKYNYKEKYLFEVNGRYDGTSRFPQDDRFGFFPSFAAAWRISKEPFMEPTKDWLTNLKLSASYGQLGNQVSSSFYPYIPSLGSNNSSFILGSGQTPFVSPAGLVSPTLTWQSVNQRNFGLDASLFKGRLNVTAEYYVRETKDMLLRVNLPDVLGAGEPLENGADLETKGWDLSVNWKDVINEDWKYSVLATLSDNSAKITKYGGVNPGVNGFYVGKTSNKKSRIEQHSRGGNQCASWVREHGGTSVHTSGAINAASSRITKSPPAQPLSPGPSLEKSYKAD